MVAFAPGVEPSENNTECQTGTGGAAPVSRGVTPPPEYQRYVDITEVRPPVGLGAREQHIEEAVERQGGDRFHSTIGPAPDSPRIEQIRDGALPASEKIARCQKLYQALNGLRPDRDKVMEIVGDLDAKQMAEIQHAYGQLYPMDSRPDYVPNPHRDGELIQVRSPYNSIPRDLRQELRDKLPEGFQPAIDAAYQGQHELATAHRLDYECRGVTSNARLMEIMRDFKGDPKLLAEHFQKVNGGALGDRLDYELGQGSRDAQVARSYLNPDKLAQAKTRIELYSGLRGGSADFENLKAELEKLDLKERKKIIGEIESAHPGEPFSKYIEGKIGERTVRGGDPTIAVPREDPAQRETYQQTVALLDDSPAREKARKFNQLLTKSGEPNLYKMEEFLKGTSPDERQEMFRELARLRKRPDGENAQAYVLNEIKGKIPPEHYEKYESLVSKGELSYAQKVHYEKSRMINSSHFEGMIKEMTGLSESEVAAQRAEYNRRYGPEANFDADLISQTSGQLRNEATRALQGLPEDPVARQMTIALRNIERAKEARQGLSNETLDKVGSEKGYTVDDRASELQKICGEIAGKKEITQEQYRKICNLNQAMSADLGMHREAKQAVTDVAVMTVPTIAVSLVPGGAGAAGAIMMRVAVGAGSYVATKAAMEGTANYQADGAPADALAGGSVGLGSSAGKGIANGVKSIAGAGNLGPTGQKLAGVGGAVAGTATDEVIKKGGQNVTNPDVVADGVGGVVGKSISDGISSVPVSIGSKVLPGGKATQSLVKNGGKVAARGENDAVEPSPEGQRPSDAEMESNIPGGSTPTVVIALQDPKPNPGQQFTQNEPGVVAERLMRDYLLGRTESLPVELDPADQRVLGEMRKRFANLKDNHSSIVFSGEEAQVYKQTVERLTEHCQKNPAPEANAMNITPKQGAVALGTAAALIAAPRAWEMVGDVSGGGHIASANRVELARTSSVLPAPERAEKLAIASAGVLHQAQQNPILVKDLTEFPAARNSLHHAIAAAAAAQGVRAANGGLVTPAELYKTLDQHGLALNVQPAIRADGRGFAVAPSLVRSEKMMDLKGADIAVPGFERAFPENFEVRAVTESIVPIVIQLTSKGGWDSNYVATLGHKADGTPYALVANGAERATRECRDAAINELGNAVAEKVYQQVDPRALVFVGTTNFASVTATGLELRESFSNYVSVHNVSRPLSFALSVYNTEAERYKLSRLVIGQGLSEIVDRLDIGHIDPQLQTTMRSSVVPMSALRKFVGIVDADPVLREQARGILTGLFQQVHVPDSQPLKN